MLVKFQITIHDRNVSEERDMAPCSVCIVYRVTFGAQKNLTVVRKYFCTEIGVLNASGTRR